MSESVAATGLREAADFLDSIAHGPTATVYVTGHADGRVDLSWQHQDFNLPTEEQRALARWMVRNVEADWRRSQHGTGVDFQAEIGRIRLRVTVDAAKAVSA